VEAFDMGNGNVRREVAKVVASTGAGIGNPGAPKRDGERLIRNEMAARRDSKIVASAS
jgi:hypothetical protein